MKQNITYRFADQQNANRFLNDIKSGLVDGARARLVMGGIAVKVSYTLSPYRGFTATAQELDDLASSLNGHEVT